MKKLRLFLILLVIGMAGLGQLPNISLAQSLNNQVKIMQIEPLADPGLTQVDVSVLGPYPNHFALTDLPPTAFNIYEDDVQVELTAAPTLESIGQAVVIIIDRSGSMNEGGIQKPELRINSARNAAISLVERLDPNTDLVGVIGFHTEIGPELPLTHDTGAARNILYDDTRMNAQDDTKTALYRTLYQALDWLVDNPDPALRDVLRYKSKSIVVFSDGRDTNGTVRPADVRDRALAHNIPIYAVGVDTGAWDTTVLPGLEAEFDDAEWIARTTDARFLLLSSLAEEANLQQFFDGLVSQRNQYRLTYRTQAGDGSHTLRVKVTTANESGQPMVAEGEAEFRGKIQLPQVSIVQPVNDYSLNLAESTTIDISVAISFPDGIERPLEKIEYYVTGDLIGTVTEPPYSYTWQMPPNMAGGDVTLVASVYDSILTDAGPSVSENQITLKIQARPTPTPLPPPTPTPGERATTFLTTNAIGLLLIPVVIVLLILLIITRRQVAMGVRTVTSASTGVLKGMTRRLGAGSQVRAKLTVVRGSNTGREFKIDANMQLVTVSRHRAYGDFALDNDEAISNPHFIVMQSANQQGFTFYIRDEQSRNGTRVNQQPLQPGQTYPLQPGSIIEVGETQLSFKQYGLPTQQFPRPTQKVSP